MPSKANLESDPQAIPLPRLSYQTLEAQGYTGFLLRNAPVRVVQFGGGNFLRGFADAFIDLANEKRDFDAKVLFIQSVTPGASERINAQDGLYSLYLRGVEDGQIYKQKRIISCVDRSLHPAQEFEEFLYAAENPHLRFIISNTTEAGIAWDPTAEFADRPPASFPAKLCRFLYQRWAHAGRETASGIVILSCELIDDNGKVLEDYVHRHVQAWGLEEGFAEWLRKECLFCSTLVDRIVTGYPHADATALHVENGYEDRLMVMGEPFALWVIEGPATLAAELPFADMGLPVRVVPDHRPYKKQKVRILNGAHTTLVPVAYLRGLRIVRDCMTDTFAADFLRRAIWEEILPTLSLPADESAAFARAVEERFQNPFIDHALLAILMNSISKWRTRVLPTLKDYMREKGSVPPCLAQGLAAIIALYGTAHRGSDGEIRAEWAGETFALSDEPSVLAFFVQYGGESAADLTRRVLSETAFWGEDLTQSAELLELADYVAEAVAAIRAPGLPGRLSPSPGSKSPQPPMPPPACPNVAETELMVTLPNTVPPL